MTYNPDPDRRPVPASVVILLAGIILATAILFHLPIMVRAIL